MNILNRENSVYSLLYPSKPKTKPNTEQVLTKYLFNKLFPLKMFLRFIASLFSHRPEANVTATMVSIK